MTPSQPARPDDPSSACYTTADGVYVVAPSGDLDHDVRERVEAELRPPDGLTPPRTVADLSAVTFMDSSGINVLLLVHRAAAAAGGWVRVAGAQESVMRVVDIVGLDTVIAFYPTVDHALKG
ncbi:STAS domain-containing protein [Streptomyces sp. NPDC057298]|uniref:STAS domain-containing protein n=1 Tax=Streptomyces sp. NPDC057298 TaxID=3346091 RepID=UPI00363632BF